MTHHEDKTNNDYLCSLNMNDAPREEKIAWLFQIIDNEISKPDEEQDLDLIYECTEFIKELENDPTEYPISDRQVDEILSWLGGSSPQGATAPVVMKPRRRRWVRVCAILAAAFVAMFATLSVAAKCQGYCNAWELVVENVEKIFHMNTGDTVEANGITLVKGGESISYNSIEELIEQEGYDFLYPAVLPDGVEITGINFQEETEQRNYLTLMFNNENISITITNYYEVSEHDLTKMETYETTFTHFYIKKITENSYQAIGHTDGYEYIILCNDYNDMLIILDNMKGIK